MANFWRFNQTLFNAWSPRQTSTEKDSLIFNNFWLQNEHFITTKVNVWNMPNINLLTYTNPKSDWGGLLDRFYKERTINIEGVFSGEEIQLSDKNVINQIDFVRAVNTLKERKTKECSAKYRNPW